MERECARERERERERERKKAGEMERENVREEEIGRSLNCFDQNGGYCK